MTEAEYLQQLADCGFSQPAVSELVSSSYTNVLFNNKVTELQIQRPLSAINFFQGLFGSKVWPDGQGMDEVREYATDPFVPIDFSYFVRSGQICDPNLANECDIDTCKIPEGGRGTLPPFKFFRWALETERTCVANIRHIRDFMYWAQRVIRNRDLIDEQILYSFYVFAAIQTAGHKITLNGQQSPGGLTLIPNSNARNPLQGGSYNYMEELFPAVIDPNLLLPITYDLLEPIARRWKDYGIQNEVATGPRGEPIYELWYGDDLWREEVLRNPDYMKSLRFSMPSSQFAGYTLMGGEQEVMGNFKVRRIPGLPRFAPTADGRVVSVDTHTLVPIEVGSEPTPSIEYENAPFGIAGIVSGQQGSILTRPTLTQSGEGFPINPIASSEPWQINNEYDATCNKYKNKPFSYKRYELGFQLDDPNAGTWFLHRRKRFNMQPISDCDLAPIFQVTKSDVDCPLTLIGCQDNKRRASNDITQPTNAPQHVNCAAESCGNSDTSNNLYRIKVDRRVNNPGFNSLNCECGDTVQVFIYNEAQEFQRTQEAVIQDTSFGFPYAVYFVEVTGGLSPGECIKGIQCAGEDPELGNVLSSEGLEADSENLRLRVVLDGSIGCSQATDTVTVRYYSSANVLLDTVSATVESYNPSFNTYIIRSTDADLLPLEDVVGASYMTVECTE